VLDQDEAKRLLAMASSLRDQLLLSLGYGAGLRASEILRLRVKHIDSAQMVIHVQQSKSRKERLVMLSPDTLVPLRQWWKARPKRQDWGIPMPERLLFPGRKAGAPLSTHQLNNILHKAADAAGIRKAVNVHTLRHSFATHLYDRDIDIRTIQALLGHDKLVTTARYACVATGLISAVESPLDRLDMPRNAQRKRSKVKA
jgi:integrase/recombinase XerD